MTALLRLIEPFAQLVRWGEPWDVEDDDPMLDMAPRADDATALNLWR